MLKEINKDSFANLRKHFFTSYMICFIGVIFLASLLLFGLISYIALFLLIIPFVVLPFLFAVQVSHYGLRQNVEITVKGFLKYFVSYFSKKYRGVYRFFVSLIYTLLTFIFCAIIFSFIARNICASNYSTFNEAYNALTLAISHNSMLEFNEVVSQYGEVIEIYSLIALLPSVGFTLIVFIYSTTYNSLMTYFRIKNTKFNPSYAKSIYRFAIKNISWKLQGSYWGLNFPLFILFIGGYIGGYFIAHSLGLDLLKVIVLSVDIGVLAAGLYYPFLLSNLESTYFYFGDVFKEAPVMVANMMLKDIQSQISQMSSYRDKLNEIADKDKNNDRPNQDEEN